LDSQSTRAEVPKWHAELAKVKMVERTGVRLDTEIDYTPLPLLWEHGGLSFVALQTGKTHSERSARWRNRSANSSLRSSNA
jgi:hypothetical protein